MHSLLGKYTAQTFAFTSNMESLVNLSMTPSEGHHSTLVKGSLMQPDSSNLPPEVGCECIITHYLSFHACTIF